MNTTTLIGFIAAICTTIAFIPQALKTIKTRHTKDLSFLMYLIFSTGVLFWLVYGLLLGEWPIIFANTITLVLTVIILILKIRHG